MDDPPIRLHEPEPLACDATPGSALNDYAAQVSAIIVENGWRQSRDELRDRSDHGHCMGSSMYSTRMLFTVDRSGRVLDVWLTGSSGRYFVDNYAMKALKTAKLPPPPEALICDRPLLRLPFILHVEM